MRDVWTCCKPNQARNRRLESLIKSQRCLSHTAQAQSCSHGPPMLQSSAGNVNSHAHCSHDGPVDAASLEATLETVQAAVCYGVFTSHHCGFPVCPTICRECQCSESQHVQQSTAKHMCTCHMHRNVAQEGRQVPLSRAETQAEGMLTLSDT